MADMDPSQLDDSGHNVGVVDDVREYMYIDNVLLNSHSPRYILALTDPLANPSELDLKRSFTEQSDWKAAVVEGGKVLQKRTRESSRVGILHWAYYRWRNSPELCSFM